MSKTKLTSTLLNLSLIAVLLAVAIGALQFSPAQASQGSVTLTIDNRSSSRVTLTLRGPAYYFFKVDSEDLQKFSVLRGTYSFVLTGCGMRTTGTLYLKQDTNMINPVCGGKVRTAPKDNSKIDLGARLKVVPVTISSDLEITTKVVLTGPSTYVFFLRPGEDREVTIGRGVYNVNYFACGVILNREFTALKNSVWTLTCR